MREVIQPILLLLYQTELEFAIVMMLTTFVGSIWMFWDASERYGPTVALLLVVFNVWIFLKVQVPLLLFGYIGFIFLQTVVWDYISAKQLERRKKEIEKYVPSKHDGVKRAVANPKEEARKMGLPEIYTSDQMPASEPLADPEIENLLKEGKIEEALTTAEEKERKASQDSDTFMAELYRSYKERIQRGEW